MANTFWGSHLSDPKRKYRFLVQIGTLPDWIAVSAQKPTFELGSAEHQFLNHTFKYPGRVTWNDVQIVVRDNGSPDVAGEFMSMLKKAGYYFPIAPGNNSTVSKAAAVAAFGNIVIRQIDDKGNTLEKWTLVNAWFKSVQFSDLDYSSDDLVDVTLTVTYDWAELSPGD